MPSLHQLRQTRDGRRAIQRLMRTWGSWEPQDVAATLNRARKRHPGGLGGVERVCAAYANNRYSVQEYPPVDTAWGFITHVIIGRHDGKSVFSWPDIQRIKDELYGPDRWALQCFPPTGLVIDRANLYHLWILSPGQTPPLGLDTAVAYGSGSTPAITPPEPRASASGSATQEPSNV